MKLFLPIFLFSCLSFFCLDTRAYAEQDTIIKYTNAVSPEYKVDFVISGDNPNTSFKPNPSTAEQASSSNTSAGGVISFPNGKEVEVAETPTSIEDKEGKIYAVGEDGKVTKVAEKTKATESLAGNMSTREKEISEGAVSFSAYKGQIYAFDEYNPQYTNASDYAKKYEEFGGEKVAVKSIARGKPDRVSIAFDGGMPIDSIYFLTPAGVRYKAEKDEQGGYFLNLIGGESNDAQEVYAILPNRQDTTKPYSIGKLIVAAYPRQEKTLTLVAVNGAKVDTAGVVKKINEIYNPLNIYWKINIAENFENKEWDIDGDDALNVMGSKWYSTYTDEMKALKNAYTQQNNIDPRMLYMFVLNRAKTDNETNAKTILGDMPRGKQFGFLFTEKSDPSTLAKTIAHELGHGYFQLKHPFGMGLTQNDLPTHLMDYGGGTEFNKYEWDLMHDPGIVTGSFESDTSGQLSMLDGYSVDFEIGEQTSLPYQIFISPAGKPVLIEGNIIPFFNSTIEGIKVPVGALTDFLLTTNGQPIWYQGHIENGQFLGYRREINNDYVYYSDINGKYKSIIERIANKDESVLQELKITQFSALPILVGGITTDIEGLIAKEIISKGGNILRRGAIIGRIGLVVGAIWELFTMPSYVEHIGQGTLILEFPFAQATTTDEYLKNPLISIPTTIPFDISKIQLDDKDKCKVYVIFRIGTTNVEVAKYGITCQTETDGSTSCKRPKEQCIQFNKEDPEYKYYYAFITPIPVSKPTALLIERAMTAEYIHITNGYLPPKHQLPCFVKIPDNLPDLEKYEKLDDRIDKANNFLNELLKQYGK